MSAPADSSTGASSRLPPSLPRRSMFSAFVAADSDGNHRLTLPELAVALRRVGYVAEAEEAAVGTPATPAGAPGAFAGGTMGSNMESGSSSTGDGYGVGAGGGAGAGVGAGAGSSSGQGRAQATPTYSLAQLLRSRPPAPGGRGGPGQPPVARGGERTYTFEEFQGLVKVLRLRRLFAGIDADSDGEVTRSELRRFMAREGVDVSGPRVADMLARTDKDGNSTCSWPEFYAVFLDSATLDAHALASRWATLGAVDTGSDLCTVPPPKNLQLWRFMLAGGMGGVVSRTATAPLERLTILGQTQAEGARVGTRELARRVIARQGYLGLFQGNGAGCLRVFPFGGMVCLAYSQLVTVLPTRDAFHPMEPFYRGVAGGLAGATAMLATYPLDVVKSRMSALDGHQYRSIRHCVRHLVQTEGVRGLYRGVGPSVVAIAPFLAVQQSSYDVMKQLATPYFEPGVGMFIGLGAFAGLCAQSVVHPMDVIRRRLQVDVSKGKNRTALQTAAHLWSRHGVQGLYHGYVAAALKIMPAVATSLLVRDALLGRLDKEHREASKRAARSRGKR